MKTFKRIILAVSVILSLILVPIPVHADSTAEVSDFQAYRAALEDDTITHIKLMKSFDYGHVAANYIEIASKDSLKEIDFNGYTISQTGVIILEFRNYDEFKIVFRDSSPQQNGGCHTTSARLIGFEPMNTQQLKVEILSGKFTSQGHRYPLFTFEDWYDRKDISLLIKGGTFGGSSCLFYRSFGHSRLDVDLSSLVYERDDGQTIRLTLNAIPLKDLFDTDQYDMFVDGSKVTDYDSLANADENAGQKIEIKGRLTIGGLTEGESLTYNGSPQGPSGTLLVEDNQVPVEDLEVLYQGRETTTYESADPPTDVGDYQLTCKIPDDYPKYCGSVTYTYAIVQAAPSYTLPADLVGYTGEGLSTILLPQGFTWDDPTTVMGAAGLHSFKATYTPTDTHNYLTVPDLDIEVLVKSKYQVTTSVVGNGAITPGASVVEGETFTIEVTPALHHHLEQLTINGVEIDMVTNTYDVIVNEDLDILARFAIDRYSVIVLDHDADGVTVTPSGVIPVDAGDDLDLEITVKPGYRLLSVLVNEVDHTAALAGDILTLSNITSTQSVKVNVEKIVYPFISGENSSFTLEESDDIEIIIDADLSNLDRVELGGQIVEPAHYEAKEGSLVVTLKNAYLDSLKPGTYPLAFVFKDGAVSETSLHIRARAFLPGTGVHYTFFYLPLAALLMMILGAWIANRQIKRIF